MKIRYPKYLKFNLALIIGVFLLLGIQAQPTAQPIDPNNPGPNQPNTANNKENETKAKYAPGRFIVKFKSQGPQALNGDTQYLLESNQSFGAAVADGLDSLDKLNQKHKVKNARSLFVERHGLTTADAMQKQNNGLRSSMAMHRSRSQRAPKDAVIPDLSNIYVLDVAPESDIEAIVREYQSDPHVEYAQPDYIMETNMVPNDPYYSSYGSWGQTYDDLWGLKNIQAEQAWDITQGEGIIVAVVDTGLDYNHPDIAANVWTNPGEIPNNGMDDDGNGFVDDVRGWDFANNDNDPMDGHGHGTHVSGTIAAVGNNGIGIIGVAPKAKIMPLKGLDNNGSGWIEDLAKGIVYAAQNGADVINNSWGCGFCPSNPVAEEAVRVAYGLGCVVVFAAGNSSDNVAYHSPQNMVDSKPVVVAATDQNDNPTYFTNIGTLVDVSAPGGGTVDLPIDASVYNLLSLKSDKVDPEYSDFAPYIVGRDYLRLAGTSMAAPHAAGVAALMLSYNPSLSNETLRLILRASADDMMGTGFDVFSGAGRINAVRAVQSSKDSALQAKISAPATGTVFQAGNTDSVTIIGTATGGNFKQYDLFYGQGGFPSQWVPVGQTVYSPVENGMLGTLSINNLADGTYLLRLVVISLDDQQFQDVVQFSVESNPPLRITNNPNNQWLPVIYGNRIVWMDDRNGSWDVYAFDLLTNTEQRITSNPYTQQKPRISGTKIVWEDNRHTKSMSDMDIYSYDFTTGITSLITPILSDQFWESQNNPSIWGDRVVWEDSRNWTTTGKDIYLYDLVAKTERQITVQPSVFEYNPYIFADRIVYERAVEDKFENTIGYEIVLYDLSVNTEQQIAPKSLHFFRDPVVSEYGIAWCDINLGSWDIYFQDMASGISRPITTNLASQLTPEISENRIVWMDNRNGNWDIYLYDIVKNREYQITSNLENDRWPSIAGDKVVWHGIRNGDWDIYLYSIPMLQPIGNKIVEEGQSLAFTISASDVDGHNLIYSADSLPVGAIFDKATKTFSWTPAFNQVGTYQVTFIVSDGKMSDEETVVITVTDVPNLLANPDFEQDKQNWAFPANGSIDTMVFQSGMKSAKLAGTGTITSTPRFSVTPFRDHTLAGWVKTQAIANGSTTAYGVRIRIQWYDAAGKLLASQALVTGIKGTIDWIRYTKQVAPPVGAATARLQLQIYGSGTTGSAWFDGLAVTPAPDGVIGEP